jgi:hypothetical protein
LLDFPQAGSPVQRSFHDLQAMVVQGIHHRRVVVFLLQPKASIDQFTAHLLQRGLQGGGKRSCPVPGRLLFQHRLP